MPFAVGQRWLSESQPELGLGSVHACTDRTVTLVFPATGETRQYALESAPLRRVRFQSGDTIQIKEGASLLVETVVERGGLLVYRAQGRDIPEIELNDRISFNSPEARMRAWELDSSAAFDLRFAALQVQHARRKAAVRGFVGGRIELIPHQLSVALEVAGRMVPRVLLADEVGLGKTIEACLIVHRWIQTGRARRILILVPESLVLQWFVELLRRFNLWFHIFDEERCEAIESANPGANPFLDDQWALCALNLLSENKNRFEQAAAAGWDLMVVDEAHHLGWAPNAVSPEYAVVEAIGTWTPALLLLTATPEQLGLASHFARLRLLDPDRYYSLDAFLEEAAHFQRVAGIAEKLLHSQRLAPSDILGLVDILRSTQAGVEARVRAISGGDSHAGRELLNDLIDQHGPGRVVFRNTRAVIKGFPERVPRLVPLAPSGESPRLYERLADEFEFDTAGKTATGAIFELKSDPRIQWLADFLRELKQEKVLLICRSQVKAIAIHDALRQWINVNAALFHEGLSLIQRDRNAAWFADEDGAQILMASEIGSEGRNFQFAHHLVLFDLPLDPEVLEQRIGRLDRIGQKSEIQVHVPYVIGSPQEVLARWFHDGLNAFAKHIRGGHALLERFGPRVHDLAQDFHETQGNNRADLEQLIHETQSAAADIAIRLETGRDRLLELNSFRPEAARHIIEGIRQADQDRSLEMFLLSAFDHFNIQVEDLAPRTYHLGSAGVFADTFPGLPTEGVTLTLDRERALARENIQFLTWDHPLVTGALDLILGSALGNSSLATWPQSQGAALYLETVYLLECIAPPSLHVDRFLPPTPIRVLVDQRGSDSSAAVSTDTLRTQLKPTPSAQIPAEPELWDEWLPTLLQKAQGLAQNRIGPVVQRARSEMNEQLGREISRLKELQKVNSNVTPAEIAQLTAQQRDLDQHLAAARLRLDAVRLIV